MEKNGYHYEAYSTASKDWIIVDEVADKIIKAMRLGNVRKIYKPILHA